VQTDESDGENDGREEEDDGHFRQGEYEREKNSGSQEHEEDLHSLADHKPVPRRQLKSHEVDCLNQMEYGAFTLSVSESPDIRR
jgi:hypothetical protein